MMDRDSRLSPAGARARRARAAVAGLLLLPNITGCYTYTPVYNAEPMAGSEITVGLTDRGRVALSDRIGPGARTVTGRLASAADSFYVVNVTGVSYIEGGRTAKWNGEQIDISKNAVSGIAERHLSRSRSWLAAGITAGVLALATTLVIKGTAGPAPDSRPTGGGPQPQ